MIIHAIRTSIFREGGDLLSHITTHIPTVSENSVIVITSKIVALTEKRTTTAAHVHAKEELIRKESDIAIPTKMVWLTIKQGMVMATAGIDESNADGKLILLPKNSFKTARLLRTKLKQYYKINALGILITDSRTIPLRAGVAGIAMGYAGFRGIRDYRGKLDIFGRKFKFARTNIADSLATAATVVMGEGNEQQPLAIIEQAPIVFCDKIYRNELYISIQDDMYAPLFAKMYRKHIK